MLRNKKIFFSILIAVTILACLPAVVLAAADSSSGGSTKSTYLTNPLGTTDAPTLIGKIIKAALGIVGSIALLMFIYGGFLWLTSGGSADKIKKGKDVIVWAVIGLVVVFLSYTAVNFLISNVLTGKSSDSSKNTTYGCCETTYAGCFDGYTETSCTSGVSGTFYGGNYACNNSTKKCESY